MPVEENETIEVVCEGCLNRMYFSVSTAKDAPLTIMPKCPECGYKFNITSFGKMKEVDRILKMAISALKNELEEEGIEAKMEIMVTLDKHNKAGITHRTRKYYGE